jgi:hypothetical protein
MERMYQRSVTTVCVKGEFFVKMPARSARIIKEPRPAAGLPA